MKLRRFRKNTYGSAWPIIVFFICLGVASVTVLVLGEIFEPFMNLMEGDDPDIEIADIPRQYVSQFFQLIWPKGLLLGLLIGLTFAVLMDYQKIKYMEA